MLTLAFDTATDRATSAVVADGETLAERASEPRRILEDVDQLLRQAGVEQGQLEALAVGTGPGSFTGLRMGLAAARALAFALDLPVAGVSTLDALAAGAPGSLAVIDARRHEIFTLVDGAPVAMAPEALAASLANGSGLVGDGAVRYREVFAAVGADVPPDDSELHLPRASLHARLATNYGPADEIEPIYVRAPDADRVLQ
ncbi:MAG TPA: tRNA (adenosine(37)-N6)-threonylcarbamoyltransferase complex dimerization subunit type 1 TsaB [Gaiellaceae bacterium]|jgi:tRNA threonylcarbamoyladenosine biosynthesis protein TsaB|nr:tRNA (adenosine(37)-N6)-threonylcarbamoyltransferase complex dimerization subunit type 1 TsaB [Gaiellaceae bacterium]